MRKTLVAGVVSTIAVVGDSSAGGGGTARAGQGPRGMGLRR